MFDHSLTFAIETPVRGFVFMVVGWICILPGGKAMISAEILRGRLTWCAGYVSYFLYRASKHHAGFDFDNLPIFS